MANDEVYYVAVSEYLVPAEGVLDHLVEHRAWSKNAYDAGIMLFSGRQDPPVGGVLAFRAGSRAEAEAFIASDPFAMAGVASYTIIGFTPTHLPWRSAAFQAFADGP
jgi:uncharacterized protein YciI